MSKNTEKLTALSEGKKSRWLQKAIGHEAAEEWSDRSIRIALNVLDILRKKNMSKQELAQKMNVSAQYVSKIVKGHENLTLETIEKIEKALDVQMIEVFDFSERLPAAGKRWSSIRQTRLVQSNSEQTAKYRNKTSEYNYSYAS